MPAPKRKHNVVPRLDRAARWLAPVAVFFVLAGVVLGNAIASIGLGVALSAIFAGFLAAPWRARERVRDHRWPVLLSLAWVIAVGLQLLYSNNANGTAHHLGLQIAGPVFVLLLCIAPPNVRVLNTLIYTVFPLLLVSLIVASVRHYFAHEERLLYELTWSHAIPILFPWRSPEVYHESDISHIYFSAFSATMSVILLARRAFSPVRRKDWRSWSLAVLDILVILSLVYYLHLFGERTGLMVLYGGLGLTFTYELAFRRKRWRLFVGAVLVLSIALVGAYYALPTLRERVRHTTNDLAMTFEEQDVSDWSIGRRVGAWQTGYRLFLSNPLIGVGDGDIPDEMQRQYQQDGRFMEEKEQLKQPHNEYLETAVGGGLVGLVLLLALLGLAYRKPADTFGGHFAVAFLACIMLAFISESILSRQTGAYFFWLFWAVCVVQLPLPSSRKAATSASSSAKVE
ncbi:MAG: O-antigen ligase family protein [Bacteroidota bacterium]